jgi:hypothetical protein
MAMSASLRKRVEEFVQKFGFRSFQVEDGVLVMYKPTPTHPNEPFELQEYTKDSEIRKAWTELQLDLDSEN